MLRITRKANSKVAYKFSGQLKAENVAEIGTLIEAQKKESRIVLDSTDLRSVDGEAVKFLEKWEAESVFHGEAERIGKKGPMPSSLILTAKWKKWYRVLRYHNGFGLFDSVRFGLWLARG